MSDIWGLLAKAQDNAQTINEAITAAILAHEVDADSHLGTGESLESHKASEIIDHVVGSIVTDKMTMTEYSARTIFESFDKWVISGNVVNTKWPGARLWSDYSPANPATLVTDDVSIPDYIDYTKNILFQVLAQVKETINKKVYFGHGFIDSGDVVNGIGFKIVNGTLYGYSCASNSLETVEITGVTLTDTHCYRAQWDKDLKKVIFFIDGVQGGSITTNTPTGDGDGEILLSLEATATGECYLYIFDLFTSRGI